MADGAIALWLLVALVAVMSWAWLELGRAVGRSRWWRRFRDRLAGRLSGMPTLVARNGCVQCGAGEWQPHRYAGCPENVRQIRVGRPDFQHECTDTWSIGWYLCTCGEPWLSQANRCMTQPGVKS